MTRRPLHINIKVVFFKWEIRSDHLLTRPYCPQCRKITTDNLKGMVGHALLNTCKFIYRETSLKVCP